MMRFGLSIWWMINDDSIISAKKQKTKELFIDKKCSHACDGDLKSLLISKIVFAHITFWKLNICFSLCYAFARVPTGSFSLCNLQNVPNSMNIKWYSQWFWLHNEIDTIWVNRMCKFREREKKSHVLPPQKSKNNKIEYKKPYAHHITSHWIMQRNIIKCKGKMALSISQ